MSVHGRISRRTLLKGIALFSAAAVPLLASATAAEAKATKSAVHYQDFRTGCGPAVCASSSFRRAAVAPA